MPGRYEIFENGAYYHIYNRGVAKQSIFHTESDYYQALTCLKYYQYFHPPIRLSKLKTQKEEHQMEIWEELEKLNQKLVNIVAFVFMPNHWHFLLRQNMDDGISKFVSQFSNSYSKYYNTRQKRVGPIFQGVFKSVKVESEEQLLHLSRYIHLNPAVSGLVKIKNLVDFRWSSLSYYVNNDPSFLYTSPIIHNFSARQTYYDFIYDHFDYARQLEIVKHQLLDIEE